MPLTLKVLTSQAKKKFDETCWDKRTVKRTES